MNEQFQYDVFLSHNSADKPQVRRLAERLRAAGLRVWFDEWIIQPGDDIYLAIERGLESSRTLVLCLSPAAMRSDWVGLERSTVLFRDPANTGRRFIPLLLADCKLPDTLRRYKHVDFREEIQAAFDQLLAGCRPQENQITEVSQPPSMRSSMPTPEHEEQWRRADEEVWKNLPPGVKLVRTLRGHTGWIGRIAWSPDGRILASPSVDKTVRLWDAETGACLHTLEGHEGGVASVAFDPMGSMIASGSSDKTVKLWNTASGRLIRTLEGWEDGVRSVAFSPEGGIMASGSGDCTVKLWDTVTWHLLHTVNGEKRVSSVAFDPAGGALASGSNDHTIKIWDAASGRLLRQLEGHQGWVLSVSFDPVGRILASGSNDKTIRLWAASSGRLLHTLEGHTRLVPCVGFTYDGQVLASKSGDSTIRIWSSDTGDCLGIIPAPTDLSWRSGLAFHPRLPLLAVVASDPSTSESDRVIQIFKLDLSVLLRQRAEPSMHYVNAKVVLVGDTGVGKSGLSLVLNNQRFVATDSTPGRRVWTFDSQEVKVGNNIGQTRETLLWDLAGQPGYRVIHQLHLNEVAVALVVFDARSETDPLAGVRRRGGI